MGGKKSDRGREREREEDEERIGGFTFLIYRSRCQRSPSSRQYLENLKGAAAGLERGLEFPSTSAYLLGRPTFSIHRCH